MRRDEYTISTDRNNILMLFNPIQSNKVTMVTKEAAQEAIKDPNPMIDGRKANVNLAYLGAKPRNAAVLSNAAAAAAAASIH